MSTSPGWTISRRSPGPTGREPSAPNGTRHPVLGGPLRSPRARTSLKDVGTIRTYAIPVCGSASSTGASPASATAMRCSGEMVVMGPPRQILPTSCLRENPVSVRPRAHHPPRSTRHARWRTIRAGHSRPRTGTCWNRHDGAAEHKLAAPPFPSLGLRPSDPDLRPTPRRRVARLPPTAPAIRPSVGARRTGRAGPSA